MQVHQLLSSYLSQPQRLQPKLHALCHMLSQLKNPLQHIQAAISSTSQPLKLFKSLILIHECHIRRIPLDEAVIATMARIRTRAKCRTPLDGIVCERVLPQYGLYLQKCMQVRTQGDMESGAGDLLYQRVNLLRIGLDVVDIVYVFGRYFGNEYKFVLDFNLALGRDFRELYDSIKGLLMQNRRLWNESLKSDMEHINEKMYVVYYNCYYYRQLREHVPKWIDTDDTRPRNHTTAKKPKNRGNSSNLEMSYNMDYSTCSAVKVRQSGHKILNQTAASLNSSSIKQGQSGRKKNYQLGKIVTEFTVEDATDEPTDSNQAENRNNLDLLCSLQRVVALMEQRQNHSGFNFSL